MQRLEQVTPEEMPEVVKVASELYQSDRDAQERRAENEMNAHSAAKAAEEMGLPREYMERAAEVVQQRRIEQVKRKRRRRNGLLATVGALVAVWGGWTLTHPAAPPAVTYAIGASAQPWRLDSNVETKAGVSEQTVDGRKAAVLKVESFARNAQGTYWANYTTNLQAGNLSGYKRVSFQVKGTGLKAVRLYIEAGPNERWRSQAINITPQWQQQSLNLRDFDHQTRGSGQWKRVDSTNPGKVERFSFKVGDYMNDVTAKGDVAISDLRLEAE